MRLERTKLKEHKLRWLQKNQENLKLTIIGNLPISNYWKTYFGFEKNDSWSYKNTIYQTNGKIAISFFPFP